MREKTFFTAIAVLFVVFGGFTSCDDEETYAEQKERERNAINSFISKGACVTELDSKDTILYVPPIKVISEEQFKEQDSTTDVSKNEYVLLSSKGIYMQIVKPGIGKKIESGENAKVINRFMEFNIMGDSLMCRNNSLYYIAVPDLMTVSNSYGVFTASYISGVMYATHNSTAVPEGWLVPLNYIKVGRESTSDEEKALVRVIVPHSSGTSDAQSGVYPCYYELQYQRGR